MVHNCITLRHLNDALPYTVVCLTSQSQNTFQREMQCQNENFNVTCYQCITEEKNGNVELG